MPSIWVNSILSFIRLFLVFGNQEKSQSNVNSSWPHSFMRRLDQKGKQQKPLWPFYSFIKHFLAFILRDLFFSLFPVYSLFFEIITLAFCYDCCCCFPVITIIFPLKFLSDPHTGIWLCSHLLSAACTPRFRNSGTSSLCSSSISVPSLFEQGNVLAKADKVILALPGWGHDRVVCSSYLSFMFSSSRICSLLLNLKFEFQNIRNFSWARSRVLTEIKTIWVAIRLLHQFIPTIYKCIKFMYLSSSKWSTHLSFLFQSCYSLKCYLKDKS